MPQVPLVRIVEQDDDVYEIAVTGEKTQITVITRISVEQNILVLDGLHIHGEGPGASSAGELVAAARELGRQFGVTSVIIYGGVRTSGANPGHRPHPITIQLE